MRKIFNLQKYNFSKKLTVNLPFKDLTLKEKDPEIFDLIEKEKRRQWAGLELIASENYTSRAVLECLGI
jgi:glycine/serine hydroxymethyltransferase